MVFDPGMTGANKGIGFEISRQLGKHGFTVILAARDEKKVAEAAARLQGEGLDAHGVVLDVTNPSSAEAAARWVDERYGRLDVLVNNAGVGYEFATGTKPSQLTMETLKATYDTNFFGVFAVMQHMLPLLRKSASPRIINQSSTLGRSVRSSDPQSPYLRRQPARLQLVQDRTQRPDAGVRQGTCRGAGVRQLGLPRLGQNRFGIGRRPTHSRTGCCHRREVGDNGRPADRQVPRRPGRDSVVADEPTMLAVKRGAADDLDGMVQQPGEAVVDPAPRPSA